MFKGKIKSGVATDSLLLTIVKLVTMSVGIVITMLLSKKFSLADYGTYSQALLIISMGTSLSILGLTDAVNYFYNSIENEEKRKNYLSTIFVIQCFVGLICAVVILLLQQQISQYFDNENLKYIYIYIAFTPLINNLLAMYQVLFISIGKSKIIAIRNLYVSISKLLVVFIACSITESVVTIFILLLITDILQVVYFTYSFSKYVFSINLKYFKMKLVNSILSYSIPLAIYIITNALNRDIDKLVIGKLTNTETLAIYTNCAKILPFDVFTTSFAFVMIPYITRFVVLNKYEESQRLFHDYLKFAYTTTWIIAFGAIITAPELITFLYSEKYLPGIWIFITYVGVDMIRFANVSIILRAKGKSRILMIYSITSLLANGMLNVLFFHFWGIIGPAIATLLITFILNMTLLVHGSKILNTKLWNLIDFKDIAFISIQLLIAGGVTLYIRYLLKSFGVNSIAVLIISYGLYIMGLGLFNFKKVVLSLKNMNHINII